MKWNLVFLAFVTFSPLYAFGDYVPGRTRASATADMAAQKGDGRYEAVKSANAVQFITDGKGYTQFTVKLDERAPIPFKVTEIRPSRCGQVFLATFEQNGQKTLLRIDEINPAACRGEGPATWRSQLSTDEGNHTASHLVLMGKPEFLMLSQ